MVCTAVSAFVLRCSYMYYLHIYIKHVTQLSCKRGFCVVISNNASFQSLLL